MTTLEKARQVQTLQDQLAHIKAQLAGSVGNPDITEQALRDLADARKTAEDNLNELQSTQPDA